MAKKKPSLAGFQDCRQVMDIAVEHDGLIYELDTVSQAVRFAQRCYQFRTFLQQLEEERLGQSIGVSTPYDILTIHHVNKEPGETRSRFLQFRHQAVRGRIHLPDGETFTPEPEEPAGLFDFGDENDDT